MCRISNTVNICLSHMHWFEDALAIRFAHQKNDQFGERNRDPRHIYANPLKPETCTILSLGIYFLCFTYDPRFPQLFNGCNQYERYSKFLQRFISKPDVTAKFQQLGVDPSNIGTHSLRKGAATFVTSGSTICPSSTATSLRAGWTMGKVEQTYLRYEAAGDQYVGRTVSGLPIDSEEFGILPPFFDDDFDITSALRTCFPTLPATLDRIATFALASVIYHSEWLRSTLPSAHPLFGTAPFVDTAMADVLKSHIQCRIGKIDDPIRATGVPAHTMILNKLGDMIEEVKAIGPALKAVQPDIIKAVSSTVKNTIIEHAIQTRAISEEGLNDAMTRVLERTGIMRVVANLEVLHDRHQPETTTIQAPGTVASTTNTYCWGGRISRVPENFRFPKGGVYISWQHYCCGKPGVYPALSSLESKDLPHEYRQRSSEYFKVMGLLRRKAEELNIWVNKPTLAQASEIFTQCKSVIEHAAGSKMMIGSYCFTINTISRFYIHINFPNLQALISKGAPVECISWNAHIWHARW